MSVDKEKLIEETAKEFCPIYIDPTHEDCELCKQDSNGNCDALKKLKKFIKNYLPKDSVVLSKEEYEYFMKDRDYWQEQYHKENEKYIKFIGEKLPELLDNKGKETAENIAKYLFNICILADIPHCMEKYFKEQFDVEIKEL